MIWKVFMGSLLAAFGAAALLLVTITGAATPTAEADVNNVSSAKKVIGPGETTTITITTDDIDDPLEEVDVDDPTGDPAGDLQILATTGNILVNAGGTSSCITDDGLCEAGARGDDGYYDALDADADGASTVFIPDAANDLRLIQVLYTAPKTGPATATVIVLQDGSAESVTITIRGTPSEVRVSALKKLPEKACTGGTANVIQSSTATGDTQASATICALVYDSTGNKLSGQLVVFRTTVGSLDDPTERTGSLGAISTLTSGETGKSGTTATVTASSVATTSATGTVDVKFGGNASACTITSDPEVLEVGQAGKVSVSVTDSTDGPVPDGTTLNLDHVSSVQEGSFRILDEEGLTTSNGDASSTILASVEGTIAVIAEVGSKTCTASVQVGGAAAPPPAPDTGMDVGFTGEIPASGFATVTFTGSIEDLKAALATSCAGGAPIFGSVVVDGVGSLIPYFPTTVLSAPNAAFEAAFAGGLSGTPLIAGNCGS